MCFRVRGHDYPARRSCRVSHAPAGRFWVRAEYKRVDTMAARRSRTTTPRSCGRLTVEAKRLLVHSESSIAAIVEAVDFEPPTS